MNAETIIVRQRRSWPRRLASELAALVLALVLLAGLGVVAARQRAGASLHRRPHRRDRDRDRAAHPHRADRRVDLRQDAAARRDGRRPAGRVPDQPRDRARLGAARLALQRPPHRPDRGATRCGSSGCRACARRARRADPARLRHRDRQACDPPARSGARRSAGASASAASSGAATIRAGRAMVDLKLALLDGDRLALRLDAEPDARPLRPRRARDRAGRRAARRADRGQAADRPDGRRARGAGRGGAGAAQLLLGGRLDGRRLRWPPTPGATAWRDVVAPAPFLKGQAAAADRAARSASMARRRSTTASSTAS